MSKLSEFVIDKLESHSANSKTTVFIALHRTFSDIHMEKKWRQSTIETLTHVDVIYTCIKY